MTESVSQRTILIIDFPDKTAGRPVVYIDGYTCTSLNRSYLNGEDD